MKITTNKLFLGILLFGLTAIFMALFNFTYFYIGAIFSFIFLTIVPGLLIMLMLKVNIINFWEYLVYTIGLSISFLMFAGLGINWILPSLNITNKPLSLVPLSICFFIFLSTIGIFAYKRKPVLLEIKFPNLDWLNKVIFLIPVLFSFLSILGTTILNNNGNNLLIMITLVGIAFYIFIIIFLRRKLNENIFPWSILFISISLLLLYSLRSWHILGWDINQEYLVFTLTNSIKHWNVHALDGAYNLCLSINILPTILESFLRINNEYIYKLIFPILFSTLPVMVYLTAKKILNKGYAFLSAVFFVSQYWFFVQMPALARQEIALIFFAGILMLKSEQKIGAFNKGILSIIFGLSMILSHYSTAYVWIIIMVIYYFISQIVKVIKVKSLKLHFSLGYIILMIVFTFLWESQLTSVADSFSNFFTSTIVSISKGLSSDMINGGLQGLTFQSTAINSTENITKNYLIISGEYLKRALVLYPKKTYQDYKPQPIFSENIMNPAFDNGRSAILLILRIIKLILTDILPIIGIFYFLNRYLFRYIRKNVNYLSNIDRESGINIVLMSICTLPLIFMIIFFPSIAIQYNTTRLYVQSLILLSNFTIIGCTYLLLKFGMKKLSYTITSALIVLFFMYSNGFVYQIIGGTPVLLLNNFGAEYDQFYITQPEINSAKWLENNGDNNRILYADQVACLRLTSFGHTMKCDYNILPSTIDKSSYVYLSNTNLQEGKVYKNYGTDFLTYTTPIEFLNNNKNLIYNSKGSEIFK